MSQASSPTDQVGWDTRVVFAAVVLAKRPLRRNGRSTCHVNDRLPIVCCRNPAAPEALSRGGLLTMHASFVALSALFCSNVFFLTDLDSHAIVDGDPALMNWQLQWVSRALYIDPSNLFNGNTFHPHPNVVALTDHMLALAVVNAPLSFLSDSPWFGYNVLILLAYYLSCIGGYWFMREVTGSHQAGVWAGIFWGFLFFRIHHMGHLQILSYQWMPFVAATLIRFLRSPTCGRALALSVSFVAQALVSWYLAVITAILVLMLTLLHAGRRLTLRHATGFAAAATLCAAVILPAAVPIAPACRRRTSAIGPPRRSFRATGCPFRTTSSHRGQRSSARCGRPVRRSGARRRCSSAIPRSRWLWWVCWPSVRGARCRPETSRRAYRWRASGGSRPESALSLSATRSQRDSSPRSRRGCRSSTSPSCPAWTSSRACVRRSVSPSCSTSAS